MGAGLNSAPQPCGTAHGVNTMCSNGFSPRLLGRSLAGFAPAQRVVSGSSSTFGVDS